MIISDEGTHFTALLSRYNVSHKMVVPYKPQTNGQDEVSNREVKAILENTVNHTRKDWSLKFDDAFVGV